MTTLGRRVQVLERRQPVACATYRFWNRTVVVTVDAGEVETGRGRPDGCPTCGRYVAVEQVVEIIGVPWDTV